MLMTAAGGKVGRERSGGRRGGEKEGRGGEGRGGGRRGSGTVCEGSLWGGLWGGVLVVGDYRAWGLADGGGRVGARGAAQRIRSGEVIVGAVGLET
ncbi:hypothetical protein B1218_37210 [Pseudomonas ogarae]|nr:hypothetical protein B1218_37210 [Pseudomonas ogarae]